MTVVCMVAREFRFPLEIEALTNGGVRGIVKIGIPFLGSFLEDRVLHTLRDQKVHRRLKGGDGAGDLGRFMSGQGARSEANGLYTLQLIPSISNHKKILDHPL